jgi:hypothetical protein
MAIFGSGTEGDWLENIPAKTQALLSLPELV